MELHDHRVLVLQVSPRHRAGADLGRGRRQGGLDRIVGVYVRPRFPPPIDCWCCAAICAARKVDCCSHPGLDASAHERHRCAPGRVSHVGWEDGDHALRAGGCAPPRQENAKACRWPAQLGRLQRDRDARLSHGLHAWRQLRLLRDALHLLEESAHRAGLRMALQERLDTNIQEPLHQWPQATRSSPGTRVAPEHSPALRATSLIDLVHGRRRSCTASCA